jgi:diacylglycerol kinase (ATP)
MLVTSDWSKRLVLIGVVFIVLIVELLNTALEKLADVVRPEHDANIGCIKDMGSAAVGLGLVAVLIVWAVVIAENVGGHFLN